MKKPKKKLNNGLIVMSRGERAGVISLLSVITVLLAFSVFRPALPVFRNKEQAFHNLDSMIALQERQSQATTSTPTAERPSKTSTSAQPIEPAKSKSSPKPSGSSKSTAPSEPKTSAKTTSVSKAIPILDINVADSTVLVELPQIGEVMASRIHRYRDRLGGFVSLDQLFEVKGMDSTRFATIKPYIVLEVNDIRKLEVNRDEFKVLLRHPYLEYDQVKAIVNHRERKGLIRNWEQLKGITGEVNPLLEKYLIF